MKLGKENPEWMILPGYGRKRLLTYAESFLGLAKLFEQESADRNREAADQSSGMDVFLTKPDEEEILEADWREEPEAKQDGSVGNGSRLPCLTVTDTAEQRNACLLHSRMSQNRALMAGHLKEMAQIMENVARQSFHNLPLSGHDRRQIVRTLREHGIEVSEVYLLETENGRLKIGITMRAMRAEVFTVEEIADFLSVLFEKRLLPEKSSIFFLKREYETVLFEEQAGFGVLTGVARAIKENEKVSGDNYSFQEIANGHFLMALSDGMGSGEKACRDSELVIELLEKYMETGFSREMAVEMINGALLARSEEENMSTLDLCDVNLYDGSAEVLKVGSAYTYIKREDGVDMLPSATLPMGIFDRPDIEHYDCHLAEGECLIMVSDGVIDCIRGEQKETALRDIIHMFTTKNTRELANNIMQYAICQSQGRIRDDMTVLTLSLWENR